MHIFSVNFITKWRFLPNNQWMYNCFIVVLWHGCETNLHFIFVWTIEWKMTWKCHNFLIWNRPRALSLYKVYGDSTLLVLNGTLFNSIKPFWFSMEHRLTALMPFWFSADDIEIGSYLRRLSGGPRVHTYPTSCTLGWRRCTRWLSPQDIEEPVKSMKTRRKKKFAAYNAV